MNARQMPRHVLDGGVVGVRDPQRCRACVSEHERLVAKILIDTGVSIEVVRRKVRQYSDRRPDARRIVELERRYLERNPIGHMRLERELGQRRSDVPRRCRMATEALEEMAG